MSHVFYLDRFRTATHQKNNLLIGFADARGFGLSNFLVAFMFRY